jgi:hypothetical protein
MLFPCPNKIACPPQGNLDYDFPLANLTSELPDHEIFVSMNWGPVDGSGSQPPMGTIFTATGCAFVCQSIISQADADQCAQEQSALCTWGGWTPPNPPHSPGGYGGSPQGPPVIYSNTLQQCSAGCPDGSLFTWTILPGQYHDLTQAGADAIAASVACQKALRFFFCLGDLTGNGQTGQHYTSTANITGNNSGPFTVNLISGALPDGLFLLQGQRSVIVNGTPTKPGTFTFTLEATDASGNFITKTYTITIKSTCTDFWAGLLAQWQFSTAGPGSSVVATPTQVTLVADQPHLALGVAQANIPTTGPTAAELQCQLTLIPLQATNLNNPAGIQFSVFISDTVTAAVYLSLNFDGNSLPLASSYPFTMPAGAKPQIQFSIVVTLNGSTPADSILAYAIQLG